MTSSPAGAERPATFWQLARPVHGAILLAGVLSGLGALVSLIPVLAAVGLIDAIVASGSGTGAVDGPRIGLLVGGIVGAIILGQVLTRAGYDVSHRADARFAELLRQRQIGHLLRLDLDWFSRTASGRIKKLVQDDVAKVHQLVAHLVPDVVNGVLRPLASLVLLLLIDWRLALLALVPLLLAVASFPLFMRYLETQFQRYNAALADLGAATVEFIRGIAPIKVFEAEGRGHRRFLRSAEYHHRFYSDWMEATIAGSAFLLVFTSPTFAITVSAVGASLLVAFGGLAPVAIVPAVLLAAGIAGPLFQLIQMRHFQREADAAAAALEEFFALPAAEPVEGARPLADHGAALDGVSFSYENGAVGLDDVSLRLEPGTVTALVGPSGSGKSTLASLVPRLIDPDHGIVRLGGADARTLPATQLYSTVGFVFQQPYLLRLSVRDNIRLGRPEATEEQVVAAAVDARIHDRILALPEGYDTVVGDGARLSGGEQQRLSIARALLMDTPLLVLDEATAYADPDSEAEIQQALSRLARGRTLLVIAHRLHTITGADRIVVLEGGRIAEQGTHEELLAAEGAYARLWEIYRGGETVPAVGTRAAGAGPLSTHAAGERAVSEHRGGRS